jgi:hypothetical protein
MKKKKEALLSFIHSKVTESKKNQVIHSLIIQSNKKQINGD